VTHVLVAYDGSPAARRALEHGADLVRPGDEVSVIHVMREPGISSRLEPPREPLTHQHQVLSEAASLLAGRGIETHTVASTGDVAVEVLAAAERLPADVIVVARRHGHHVPHVLGSISGRIVRGASCDVLVVHPGPARGRDDVA
jgi:nucleotide-binding universal stress UspA family protein